MQIECADFTWEVGSVYRAHISSSDHSLNWVEVSGELLRLWHQNQELPFCCRGLWEVRHSSNAVCGVMGWVCCQKYQALLVLRVELWQQKGKAGKGWGAAQHLFFFFFFNICVCLFGCTSYQHKGSISWPGTSPGSPALGAWSLSRWTTRELLCTAS